MKVIIKIEQYFPDTEQITFRICGLHSHKTIGEHRDYAIEISDLDMTDTESFVDSLVFKVKHLLNIEATPDMTGSFEAVSSSPNKKSLSISDSSPIFA